MRAIFLGIAIALIFGAILIMTHQGAASNIAYSMANKAVNSARMNGMWNNVTLKRKDQNGSLGEWSFEAEVRDYGTVKTYYIPVHQTCLSVNEACFHVGRPVPVNGGL